MGLELDLRQVTRDLYRMTIRATKAERELEQLKAELLDHKQFWKRDVDEFRARAEIAEAQLNIAIGDTPERGKP